MCPGATGRPSHSFFSFLLPLFTCSPALLSAPRSLPPQRSAAGPSDEAAATANCFFFLPPRPFPPYPVGTFQPPSTMRMPLRNPTWLPSTTHPQNKSHPPKGSPLLLLPGPSVSLARPPAAAPVPLWAGARPLILAPPVAEPPSWMLQMRARGAPHPSSSLPAPCPPPETSPTSPWLHPHRFSLPGRQGPLPTCTPTPQPPHPGLSFSPPASPHTPHARPCCTCPPFRVPKTSFLRP